MRPIYIERALVAADADGIATAQQLVGAGDLVLDGALVAGGEAILGSQRRVVLASAGDLSAVNFTIYGEDDAGRVASEVIAGPNNNTVTSILDYAVVTRIAASAAVGDDVTAGTSAVGSSQLIPLDVYQNPFNVSLATTLLAGAANWTVQYTFDDIWNDEAPYTWYDHDEITGVAADTAGSLISVVTAVRLLTNSGTGGVRLGALQSGVMG